MSHLDLVIFDCDGVLVDSEMIASRELAAFLSDLGRPTTDVECRAEFTGLSLQSVADKVRTLWGLDMPGGFVEQLRARDRAAFERDLKAVAHIETALDAVTGAGVKMCVASSGMPDKIRHSLTLTGLIDRFDGKLFSASEVARGKPAPDLFEHAAAHMDAEPARCVVIEDSPAGVAGAKAAGMHVLGFVGGGHCNAGYAAKLQDADAVFADMRDLGDLLKL